MLAEKVYNLDSFKSQYEALLTLSVSDTIPNLMWDKDKSDLLSLRDEFLSKEFWEYVYERLSAVKRQGYNYLNINREFSSVIKALFRCNISNETKQILGKVNALTNTIFAL